MTRSVARRVGKSPSKKVLVTGGMGLIGSSLARGLLAAGWGVHVLDKYEISIPGAKYFSGSVLDQNAVEAAMEGCDRVVHLAAILGVSNAGRNPVECLDVNIFGTRNVLESCVKMNVKRILFSSSSEVYGEPEKVPIKETAALLPKSEYGVSKVVGEEYCRAYSKQFALPYTIVRFFNVYGAEQRDDFVIPVFTNAAVAGRPLTVHGDGAQVRAFCYVDDIVDGVIKLLFSPKAENEVFNIGSPGEPITMLDLAEHIVKAAGQPRTLIRKIPFTSSDRTAARDVRQRLPDIRKVQKIIGWKPKITLAEGIKRVLAYKQKHRAENL